MIKNKSANKGNKIRPKEFLEITKRLDLIDQEIKKEGELYEIKLKSLDLEKQYLWSKMTEKKSNKQL